eukprot:TRINITY_DN2585_c0_g1_i1.p1 TRINITY_DN2585_c0_g1~~TRINITY_DN2585_c0_g1_i1.p1  ORF type:complete len:104 (+),score=25.07 TRINITY_DN2585_c0_g1_i1:108-419(+)
MIRRQPRSTLSSSSAASDVYKRQAYGTTTRATNTSTGNGPTTKAVNNADTCITAKASISTSTRTINSRQSGVGSGSNTCATDYAKRRVAEATRMDSAPNDTST